MNLDVRIALCVFVAVAGIGLDSGLGWRKISHLRDIPKLVGGKQPKVSVIDKGQCA